MSIIHQYHLQCQLLTLEEILHKINIICDFYSFYGAIKDAKNILDTLEQLVRNKRRLLSSYPTPILVYIFSFLPWKGHYIAQRVCSSWHGSLTSTLAKRILHFKPRAAASLRRWNTGMEQNSIALVDSRLFASGQERGVEVWNLDGVRQNSFFPKGFRNLAGTETVYCGYKFPNIFILTPEHDVIREWWTPHYCSGLSMDKKFIYMSSTEEFRITSFHGLVIHQWKLDLSYKARKIAVSEEEIFMTDFQQVLVFSHEGNLLRKWGNEKIFHSLSGIAVSNDDVVYVVDSGTQKILAFDRFGVRLFEVRCVEGKELEDIIFRDGLLYVSDRKRRCIEVFKLLE